MDSEICSNNSHTYAQYTKATEQHTLAWKPTQYTIVYWYVAWLSLFLPLLSTMPFCVRQKSSVAQVFDPKSWSFDDAVHRCLQNSIYVSNVFLCLFQYLVYIDVWTLSIKISGMTSFFSPPKRLFSIWSDQNAINIFNTKYKSDYKAVSKFVQNNRLSYFPFFSTVWKNTSVVRKLLLSSVFMWKCSTHRTFACE